jgi:long-chain acyl-CoA synthetase
LLGKAILGNKLEFTEKTQGMKFIGIFAKNRVEWLLTDLACNLYGLTTIPLYDTLGIENLSYCLNQTELTTLFLTEATLPILLNLKDRGNVKNVVLFDRIDKSMVDKANSMKINVLDFNTLIEEGKKHEKIDYKQIPVKP